jgi:raffinose/stachyose/melibiose transport system permease protein
VRATLRLVWVLPALVLVGVFVYLPLVQNLQFSTLKWEIYSGRQEYVGLDN